MSQKPPVNLVFGGHSPIGIGISKSLCQSHRTIHVTRSIDPDLRSKFQGSGVEFLQWREFSSKSLETKRDFLEKLNVKNLIFAHRLDGKHEPKISDFLTVEVIFPYEIINFLVENDLFVEDSNIVFITSPAAQYVLEDQPLGYHISKASVNQIVRYFAGRIGTKTKVNGVAPGSFVLKERNREFFKVNKDYSKAIRNFIPTGHIPEIEDIVAVIQFIASEENKIINGQILDLSGGYLNLEPSHIFRKLFNHNNS